MIRVFSQQQSTDGVPKLYGRNSLITKIHDYIVDREMPENIALLGVKGIGKTSIIKNAFCKSANQKYYKEASVMVAFVSIPETTDTMKGFYSYLNTAILEGLDQLEEYDKTKYDALMSVIVGKKNKVISRCVEIDDATMESVLNQTIDAARNSGLKLLIVFDDFERFADSSNLKKAQYKFMRELANSGRISLFISTGQDLTKVSEEMKGSGFENIFTYEELRGIRAQDIEDWVWDATEDTDIEFDDDVLEWIEEISGGIPQIVGEAAELSYHLLLDGIEFEHNLFCKKLYPLVYPLMSTWWHYTDDIEHCILEEIVENKSKNSINRDCLVKKGYLNESDLGEVTFASPLFELFVLEEMVNIKPESEIQTQGDVEAMAKLLQEIIREANEAVEARIEKLDNEISGITEKLSTIITEMPSRNDFYKEESGELELDEYKEAITSYISDKLVQTNDAEICEEWHIDRATWESFSNIRRNDCAMAYSLTKLVFAEDIDKLDYTPVTVMLGNFLEGILNDMLLQMLKRHMPNMSVKAKNGGYCQMKDYRGTMTIGGFAYIFKNEDVSTPICAIPKVKSARIGVGHITDFAKKLSECHAIRNKADHPGEITTYADKNKFISNMFTSPNNMLQLMLKLNSNT